MANRTDGITQPAQVTEDEKIKHLVTALGELNDVKRFQARKALVLMGSKAVPALREKLKDPNHLVRWGVVKTLCEIGDPTTAPLLVQILEDDVFDIRWLASEGLIAMGFAGLEPLLLALVHQSDIASLREGALHILHVHSRLGMGTLLSPIISALEGMEPAVTVPPAAQRILKDIQALK
ncbi:MAG: HEAT repeat domain-containing protein [Chloroflexi bacterium]|nr:HEAT repeat domain-containing protein [Chloroflexota bacterium]